MQARVRRRVPVLVSILVFGPGAGVLLAVDPGVQRADAAFPGADGRIAFWSRSGDGILSVHPNGDGLRRLTKSGGQPAWSANGRQIAFIDGTRSSNIFKMDADGSNRRRLTDDDGDSSEPAWSPSGRKIVFDRRAHYRDAEIFKMGANGNKQRRLTDNNAWDIQPKWSPDGRRIAFVRNRKTGRTEIYTMNANGSHSRQLSDTPNEIEANPDWSPNGKRILYARGPRRDTDRGWGIYVMRRDGSKVRRLTAKKAAGATQPVWSPNGKKIAFSRKGAVFKMRADGTHRRKVVDDASAPDWQSR